MDKLKVVFMGTPAFAVPVLRALDAADSVDVALVVTRPDAASGRGKALLPSEVALVADELGLPVLKTKTLRTPEVQRELLAVGADVFCVAAYGCLIPQEVLDMPPMGTLNVHASLLPAGRGAAPMQRALLEGDERVGFSIMQVELELDAGAYCHQGWIAPGEMGYPAVSDALSRMGGDALVEVLDIMRTGGDPGWCEQDPAQVTYAAKLAKSELKLDPACDAVTNMRRYQASSDAAPARANVGGRPIRVMDAHVPSGLELATVAAAGGHLPGQGQILAQGGQLYLGCADGSILQVKQVKPDGKNVMPANAFANGLGKASTWEMV